MNISLSPFAPENWISRDGFGSSVPRQSAHLRTQAECGASILMGFLPISTAASINLFKPLYPQQPVVYAFFPGHSTFCASLSLQVLSTSVTAAMFF